MRGVVKRMGTLRGTGVVAILLIATGLQSGNAAAQTVRAHVDPAQPVEGQTFTLSVEIAGGSPEDPQLPPMDDFAAFLGRGSSQRIEMVNGRMASSLTIGYTFQATKAGRFTIGAVAVEIDGKLLKTDPIPLEVLKSGSGAAVPPVGGRSAGDAAPPPGDALFVRAVPDRREVFQNQPVVVAYKIYTRIDLNSYSFAKVPSAPGFWVEDYPIGNRPETSVEVIDGRRYTTAVIKKMALYPTSPGAKTVSALQLQCEVTLPRRRDALFEDFFGGGFGRFFGETATQSVSSDEIKIRVKALPAEDQPAAFNGAVGEFSVEASIAESEVQANDAVTLRVGVSGTGNFPTMGEPQIAWPPTFEVYPPRVDERLERGPRGLTGRKTYEYVVIPRVPGDEKLGPVELVYFDPAAGSYRTSRSDPLALRVGGRADTPAGSSAAVSKQELQLLGKDIRFIKTSGGGLRKIGQPFWPPWAIWLAASLPLAACAGALLHRRRLDKMLGDVAYARSRRAHRLAKQRLAKARSAMKVETQSAFFAEVAKALNGFIADKLNLSEAGMISDQVRAMLTGKGVPEETADAYLECLRICDRERFAPGQSDLPRMEDFLGRAERAMAKLGERL